MECKIGPFMQEQRLIYNTSNLFKFENQGWTPIPTHMRRGLLTCKNSVQRWMLQWLSKHMTNRKISSLNISPKTTSQSKQPAGTFTSVCFSLGTWIKIMRAFSAFRNPFRPWTSSQRSSRSLSFLSPFLRQLREHGPAVLGTTTL